MGASFLRANPLIVQFYLQYSTFDLSFILLSFEMRDGSMH